MAYINPKTGSSTFNVKLIRKGVVSFATDEPTIVGEDQEFTLKLISDITDGQPVLFDELAVVPDEEIDSEGYWVNSKVSRLKSMSHDELISYILRIESGEQISFQEIQPQNQQPTAQQEQFETLDFSDSTQEKEEVFF
jgi:hypothetical protein